MKRAVGVALIASSLLAASCDRWYKRAPIAVGMSTAAGYGFGQVIPCDRQTGDCSHRERFLWAGVGFGVATWIALELILWRFRQPVDHSKYIGGYGTGGGLPADADGDGEPDAFVDEPPSDPLPPIADVPPPPPPAQADYDFTLGETGTIPTAGADERLFSHTTIGFPGPRNGNRACQQARDAGFGSLQMACGAYDHLADYLVYQTQCRCHYRAYDNQSTCAVDVHALCRKNSLVKARFGSYYATDRALAETMALERVRQNCSAPGDVLENVGLFGCECQDDGCVCYAHAVCRMQQPSNAV